MKSISKIVIVLFLLLAGALQSATGQAVFDTLRLNEFEVIGIIDSYQSSFKETEIDTLIKKEFEHFDLGQLLTVFSPVFIKSYGKGSIASASFRGTAASHTKVLWNDFAINSPMLGQVDFSYIPDSFFDKAGLLYGGGSLFKSGGALGGSVLLHNTFGQAEKPLLHINQSVGSFNSFNTAASLNLNYKKFSSGTRVMLQTSKNDFPYYNNGVLPPEWMTQLNASFLNGGFLQQFSWQLNAWQHLTFVSWNQWNNRNIPPIMTNVYKGGDPEEYQKTFFSRNVLGWLYHKNNTKIEIKGAFFYEDQYYYLKTTTSDDSSNVVTLIDSKNYSPGLYLKSRWIQKLNHGWEINVEFDVLHDRVNSSNYNEIKTRFTGTFFAGIKKQFWHKLTVDALLRAEMTDGELLPAMPYMGLNYQVLNSQKLFVRASVSRNYHLPTLNDLYWYPGGNRNLLPEEGMETEAGVNYYFSFSKILTLTVDVSGYYSKINNWIQWKPTDYRYWTPENIALVMARGLETSLQLSGKTINWYYRLSGEYAYTVTTDESELAKEEGYSGTQLIYIPVHHGSLFFYLSFKNWSAGWNTVITGQRNTTMNAGDSYSNTLPSYCLNDFQIGKKWHLKNIGIGIQVKVNNLFDVQYQSVLWRAMPGRNFKVILKMDVK